MARSEKQNQGRAKMPSQMRLLDSLSPSERSKRMSLIRGKHTKPELLVRRFVWSLGFRYRLHISSLPGSPDLVFPSFKKVIFVHGCFWHRHPDPKCKLARWPKSRLEFWRPKLAGNRARDVKNIKQLRKLGWRCLIVWECELKGEKQFKRVVRSFLES